MAATVTLARIRTAVEPEQGKRLLGLGRPR